MTDVLCGMTEERMTVQPCLNNFYGKQKYTNLSIYTFAQLALGIERKYPYCGRLFYCCRTSMNFSEGISSFSIKSHCISREICCTITVIKLPLPSM